MDIHIALAADEKYIVPAYTVIISVLENSNCINLHYFHLILKTDNSKVDMNFLKIIKNTYNNCEFEIINFNKLPKVKQINKNEHITEVAFARLFIPELLNNCEKCIYLDCDTIVCGDLSQLYTLNIKGMCLAGCKSTYELWDEYRKYALKLGLSSIKEYINSGVLLMNLSEMRKQCFSQRVMEIIDNEYVGYDQDLINIVCNSSIYYLPFYFNYMPLRLLEANYSIFNIMTKEEVLKAYHSPIVVHYLTYNKPWKNRSYDFGNRWLKYFLLLEQLYNENKHLIKEKDDFFDSFDSYKRQVVSAINMQKRVKNFLSDRNGSVIGIGLPEYAKDFWISLLKSKNIIPNFFYENYQDFMQNHGQSIKNDDLIIKFSAQNIENKFECKEIYFSDIYMDCLIEKNKNFIDYINEKLTKEFKNEKSNVKIFPSALLSLAFNDEV